MVTIRSATVRDLPRLAGLFNLYLVFYRKQADKEAVMKYLQERMQRNESVIYIAEEDGILTGFTQLYPQFSSLRMKRYWLLNDLFVLQEYRGRGIAKQLIEAAKQLA